MNTILVTRFTIAWIIGCSVLLIFIINKNDPFYHFGPSKDLKFIGITIDTKIKYFYICIYCFLNTIVRSINHSIIQPWITLNIQNPSNKDNIKIACAHEIVTINIVYTWFDWFIYINLLLTQVDMILIEMGSELIVSNLITWKYIKNKKNFSYSIIDRNLQEII